MAIPLQIKTLEWANFLSYGDYETSLELDSLGPILIVGRRDDGNDESNGVGKTTIATAILWCLFGRMPKKHAPGDKVVNFFTKKECYVKITTTDGWTITRTRQMNGHDDLLIHKDGEDITLSTNKNAQKFLKQTFNLDYDIFVASIFFGQRTESFLSMSDMKRKAALERMLGLDRLNVWGDVAKERKVAAEIEQQKVRAVAGTRDGDIERIREQTTQTEQKLLVFIRERDERVKQLDLEIGKLEKEANIKLPDLDAVQKEYDAQQLNLKKLAELRSSLTQGEMTLSQLDFEIDQLKPFIIQQQDRFKVLSKIDIDDLRTRHTKANEGESRRSSLQLDLEKEELEYRKLKQDEENVVAVVKEWKDKSGTKCPACKQNVTKEHTISLCKPYFERGNELADMIDELGAKCGLLKREIESIVIDRPETSINMAEQNLEEAVKVKAQLLDLAKRAKQRLDQRQKLEPLLGKTRTAIELMQAKVSEDVESRLNLAKEIHNQHDKLVDRIVDLKTKTSEEKERINPYQEVIDTLKTQLEQVQEDLSGHLLKISKLDIGIKEYEYIRRSYHDRNKIKMFILSDLVPYLNQRIEYYLNAFECDLKLTFTSTLSVETSRWGYDFHSGGQQKRIDLAIMFALYDLYISMYGQQCNVMVLDEVDGSLDPHGVRMFVDIIHNDFSGDRPDKPDTILIISHKNEMVDQFPNHVLVSMDPTGYSRIEKS